MRKSIAFAVLALTLLILSACETAPQAATPRGTPLGDTGIRVSGSVQAGASTSAR